MAYRIRMYSAIAPIQWYIEVECTQPDADTKTSERARFPYPGLVPAAAPGCSSSESRDVLLHNSAAALRAGDERQSRCNAQQWQIQCRHAAAEAACEGFAEGATGWRPRGGGRRPVSHWLARHEWVWTVCGAVEL